MKHVESNIADDAAYDAIGRASFSHSRSIRHWSRRILHLLSRRHEEAANDIHNGCLPDAPIAALRHVTRQ